MGVNIGNVNIDNNIFLAPMAGISNPSYMKICEEMNIGYAVTELISAEAVVRNNKKTLDMLKGIDSLKIPVGVQLFGSKPQTIAKAAKILLELYPIKIIDINMGCPVPKVALKSQAGSFLLKNPDKVKEIVETVSQAVPVPITVKIRSGWDFNSINAVEIAKICEQAGAKAITVHARTRSQGYSGKADWNIIKQVKENVSIPVIGNGDITSCYDAKKMLEQTGCDAVMIGRGALGNPWLIKQCVDYLEYGLLPKEITIEEKIKMIKHHFNYLLQFKPEKVALLEIRSHIAWYLKGVKNASKLKEQVFKTKTVSEINDLLDTFQKGGINER